jgi:hypothetical protein
MILLSSSPLVISREIWVVIAMGCGHNNPGFKFWQQQEHFNFFRTSNLSLGPPSLHLVL